MDITGLALGRSDRSDSIGLRTYMGPRAYRGTELTGAPSSLWISALEIFKNTQGNITQSPRTDFIMKLQNKLLV